MLDVNKFEYMKIGLASPEKIRSWSYGEVKKVIKSDPKLYFRIASRQAESCVSSCAMNESGVVHILCTAVR